MYWEVTRNDLVARYIAAMSIYVCIHHPHTHWGVYDSQWLQCRCGSDTYTILSICIPVAYIGTTEATFGIENQRIGRKAFILAWLVVSACLVWGILYCDTWWKTAAFWEWPTIVRDIVFIVGMYGEVSVMMLLAYGFSCLGRAGSSERGETK